MIFLIPVFLAWGSFLNVIAYRLIHEISFKKNRSFCTKCNIILNWFDLIPIFSWFFLKGRCRFCKQNISILYPFIEILTALTFYLLFLYVPYPYLVTYALYFSSLIITVRTDLETMLILRYFTLFLVPLGWILSILNLSSITIIKSISGSFFGYVLLYLISKSFFILTKKEGIGQGDFELMALIGSFTGILGCWISLLLGSILGSIFGISLILFNKISLSNKIPFGPFLAIGSIFYILFQNQIIKFLFNV